MKPLYTQQEFNLAKSKDLLPLQCKCCNNKFYKTLEFIKHKALNPTKSASGEYCSQKCYQTISKTKITVSCKQCAKQFEKFPNKIKRSPNHFCSKLCASRFNVLIRKPSKRNPNGTSQLEKYLKVQLESIYSTLDLSFNNREILKGLELDIYIKSLNLAFEINGIHHYEPIYGIDRLDKCKLNDYSKTKLCHKLKLDLCIINTSEQKRVTPKSSQKYLDIITKIINERIS